ncbi:MAG: DUF4337 family protein [Acetobacteraceae bacterium]|nr:DUF4337 family protein [Acetobacteraceae bacterium]
MVNPAETAHEQIHEAHHAHGDSDPWPRRMAVVVSCLAASLALAGVGAKSSQTAYLTHHISASDTWNFYQAKNLRAVLRNSQASTMEALPSADTPTVQERIKAARAEEARMRDEPRTADGKGGDGMKQLRAKAVHEEHDRDHAFHLYHGYEYTAGVLEISIVLASVSVVTRMRPLGIAAGVIGLLASCYGLAVYGQLV